MGAKVNLGKQQEGVELRAEKGSRLEGIQMLSWASV